MGSSPGRPSAIRARLAWAAAGVLAAAAVLGPGMAGSGEAIAGTAVTSTTTTTTPGSGGAQNTCSSFNASWLTFGGGQIHQSGGTFTWDGQTLIVVVSTDGTSISWTSTIPIIAVYFHGGSNGGLLYVYSPSPGATSGSNLTGAGTGRNDELPGFSYGLFCYVPQTFSSSSSASSSATSTQSTESTGTTQSTETTQSTTASTPITMVTTASTPSTSVTTSSVTSSSGETAVVSGITGGPTSTSGEVQGVTGKPSLPPTTTAGSDTQGGGASTSLILLLLAGALLSITAVGPVTRRVRR